MGAGRLRRNSRFMRPTLRCANYCSRS